MRGSDLPAEDNPVAAGIDSRSEGLETRVCRLEDAVASLQDTKPMEERIVERVSSRLADDSSSLLRSGRPLLPAAIGALNAQADIVHQPEPAARADGSRAKWFLIEIYAEARLIVRMYLDRRYRMTWIGLVIPPVFIVAIAFSYYLLPGTSLPVLGTIIDKSVDLFLAFVVFKVLSREAHRYRELMLQQYALPSPM
jgi:hypothetical protein